jgi:integrase
MADMSVAAAHPASSLPVVGFDPLLDKSYQGTKLGPDVVAWLAWLEVGERERSTRDGYERVLSKGCHMYPRLPLEEWTHRELQHVIAAYPRGSRPHARKALNGFFEWATHVEERITRNPMRKLPKPKPQAKRYVDVFTDAEVEDLFALPLIDSVLMRILIEAGLRKGEALALQVRRLKLDHPAHIVVIGGKGGKDRVVRIGASLHSALSDFLLLEALAPMDYLWYTKPGGKHVQRHRQAVDTSFDRWWTRCLKDAGVRYRKPHTTRHTYATNWIRHGGRVSTLSRQLGHSSSATTQAFYEHLDTQDVLADLLLIEATD